MFKPPLLAALTLALLTAPVAAATFYDQSGTIVPGVVPLSGCVAGGNCAGPANASNPLRVSSQYGVGGLVVIGSASPIGTAISTMLGAAPANAVGVRLYTNLGASITFTVQSSQPASAPAATITLPGNADFTMDLGGGLEIYVTAVSGSVVALRY